MCTMKKNIIGYINILCKKAYLYDEDLSNLDMLLFNYMMRSDGKMSGRVSCALCKLFKNDHLLKDMDKLLSVFVRVSYYYVYDLNDSVKVVRNQEFISCMLDLYVKLDNIPDNEGVCMGIIGYICDSCDSGASLCCIEYLYDNTNGISKALLPYAFKTVYKSASDKLIKSKCLKYVDDLCDSNIECVQQEAKYYIKCMLD